MPIIVNNIRAGINTSEDIILEKARTLINTAASKISSIHIYKKSLDARKQNNFLFVSSVIISLCDPDEEKALCETINDKNVAYKNDAHAAIEHGSEPLLSPIYIAGFGPAGIFCAYMLAKAGYKPIVLERGADVTARVDAVEAFWKTGKLDTNSNVQFGEGGAGTFSDGKLTTRISDSHCDYVLQLLKDFGAPEEILTKAKPHIGSDNLRIVVKNIREEIIRLGGQILFNHKLQNISVENNKLVGITVNGAELPTQNLILAIGHSARDTFKMLLDNNIFIEPKGFSVGVRIEHLQAAIDRGLYGKQAGNKNLPKGEYQLSHRENGRGVYTFCMCPGGTVIPSASDDGCVVTNGMSNFNRAERNANSALVVSVSPDDFGKNPLDGVAFQEKIEHKAFELGGSSYSAIGANVGSFLQGRAALKLGSVNPSYSLGVKPCNFNSVFPPYVIKMLHSGLLNFNSKIAGFADKYAVLTGVETRTSSPIKITRNEQSQSISAKGVYPCGEGAGYAGGIMSAAVDGLKIAEQIISTYSV